MLMMFCAVELALNYGEIHRYLTTTEQANYKDFKDILAIRNYLSASGMTTLRLYPRERTKKVLVSALESDDWTDRHDAAIGLQYVRARDTIPHLVGCLHRQDETDTYDQAREACAVALEILLSGRRDAAIYSNIEEEFEKDRAMLFRRLEEQALRSSANL